jgi:glucan phosphoethanolaminetransferase (alkaline phosphatase superfamily)
MTNNWTKISIVALSTFAIWLLVSFLFFRDRFAILLPAGVIVSAVVAYSATNRFPGNPTSPPSERNL